MLESDSFLKAICENPDEDGPRLIYADWLEENGDPERAEFIRLDCAFASRKDSLWNHPQLESLAIRTKTLFWNGWPKWIVPFCEVFDEPLPEILSPKPFWHPSRWMPNFGKRQLFLGDRITNYSSMLTSWLYFVIRHSKLNQENQPVYPAMWRLGFKRGFIWFLAIRNPRPETAQQIGSCSELTPLSYLQIWDSKVGTVSQLVQQETFLRLPGLWINGVESDTIQAIAHSPYSRGLKELALEAKEDVHSVHSFRPIFHSKNLLNLRSLSFSGFLLSIEDCRELVESPLIERLERLAFRGTEISDEVANVFAESSQFREAKCEFSTFSSKISPSALSKLTIALGERVID